MDCDPLMGPKEAFGGLRSRGRKYTYCVLSRPHMLQFVAAHVAVQHALATSVSCSDSTHVDTVSKTVVQYE